jgi:hypothetical protein
MNSSNKSCGECRACCTELKIDTKELQKPAQLVCPHHTGHGCGIYGKRPKICREFFCGWLLFPELDEAWRPDRSGVLVLQLARENLPQPYQAAGHGVQLLIIGGEDAVARPAFAAYVAALVRRKVAVFLHSTTPHGLVNAHLEAGILDDDAGVSRILVAQYRLLKAAKEKKGFLGLLPHLYRLRVEKRQLAAKIMVNRRL